MKIKLLSFGAAREIIGRAQLELTVAEQTDINGLRERLQKEFPSLNENMGYVIAVNHSYAASSTVLKEMDEVAIIPPVSGG